MHWVSGGGSNEISRHLPGTIFSVAKSRDRVDGSDPRAGVPVMLRPVRRRCVVAEMRLKAESRARFCQWTASRACVDLVYIIGAMPPDIAESGNAPHVPNAAPAD